MAKHYPGLNGGNYADGFVYNYYNAAWALVQGLTKSNGQLGASLQTAMPRSLKSAYEVSDGGVMKLDSNRQAIQDQYPLQIVKNARQRSGLRSSASCRTSTSRSAGCSRRPARRPAARSRRA